MNDERCDCDGTETHKLLRKAASQLANCWQPGPDGEEALEQAQQHMVRTEWAIARFQRLVEQHRLLTEVTALIAAGVDCREIGAKADRAWQMSQEIDASFGIELTERQKRTAASEPRGVDRVTALGERRP